MDRGRSWPLAASVVDEILELAPVIEALGKQIARHNAELARQLRNAWPRVMCNTNEALRRMGGKRTNRLDDAMGEAREAQPGDADGTALRPALSAVGDRGDVAIGADLAKGWRGRCVLKFIMAADRGRCRGRGRARARAGARGLAGVLRSRARHG